MNKTASEGEALVRELARLVPASPAVDILLAPPFTALESVRRALPADGRFALGAQTLHHEDRGAFTGDISAPMLLELGCRFVLVGHSERRQNHGETDEQVNKQLRAALKHGLMPILCVGESLAQREAGRTDAVISAQLRGSLASLTESDLRPMAIAYEPIWAIGTGRAATPEQANAVHALIRAEIEKTWSREAAQRIRVLYGGSVTAANASPFLASAHIDGALVGGACLDPQSFAKIIALAGSPGTSSI